MSEKSNFYTFRKLETERLILRRVRLTDYRELFFLRSDPAINQFINRPVPKNKREVKEFIGRLLDNIRKNKALYWSISLKDDPKLIGTICLWNFTPDGKTAELGYELLPQFQGKGMMSEAARKVIELAIGQLGIKIMEAFTHKDNLKSQSLLIKMGFKKEEGRIDEDNENNAIFILGK